MGRLDPTKRPTSDVVARSLVRGEYLHEVVTPGTQVLLNCQVGSFGIPYHEGEPLFDHSIQPLSDLGAQPANPPRSGDEHSTQR